MAEPSRNDPDVADVDSHLAPDEPQDQFPVVAVGASAGGLAAYTTLLASMPPDTGMAFVLVQHLDPHHDSMLVGLLSRATAMPVVQIQDQMALSPNRVHVIPSDAALTMSGQVFGLLPRGTARPPMPVDGFLRALAENRRSQAIAVILSGTGSDGSLGVQAVREQGGVTLAQDPDEAEFDGMPRSAIATGCVDVVLPVARLGEEIARIGRDHAQVRSVPRGLPDLAGDEDALRDTLALLRVGTGVDFGLYRKTTVRRRLQRRLFLRGVPGLREYVEHLHANPGELQELGQDLLIHVTRFFRDPEVFEFLAQTAFPDLIRRASSDGVARLWVPGCSTGEEAYSLAMSFAETAHNLVCSGLGDATVETTFAQEQVSGFIHKPFTIHELAQRVAECLPSRD